MTVGRLAIVILAFSVAAGGFWLGSQDRAGSQVAPITLTDDEPEAVRREDDGSEVESVADDDDPAGDPPSRGGRGADATRGEAAADASATGDGDKPAPRQAATDDGAEVNREPANSAPAGPVAADDTNDQPSDDDGGDSASDNT